MPSRNEAPSLPPAVAVLPFLFMPGRPEDPDWILALALAAASAAESAVTDPSNSRQRIAWLLSEFGFQYGRRTGQAFFEVPLSRTQLAQAARIPLPKVKRIMALLQLSQVIETDGERLKVIDWRRLCAVGHYPFSRLQSALGQTEEDDAAIDDAQVEPPLALLTQAGDPACFE